MRQKHTNEYCSSYITAIVRFFLQHSCILIKNFWLENILWSRNSYEQTDVNLQNHILIQLHDNRFSLHTYQQFGWCVCKVGNYKQKTVLKLVGVCTAIWIWQRVVTSEKRLLLLISSKSGNHFLKNFKLIRYFQACLKWTRVSLHVWVYCYCMKT